MDMKIVVLSLVSFSLVIPPALGSLRLAQAVISGAFDGAEHIGDKMADLAENIVRAKTGAVQSIVGAKGDFATSLVNLFRKNKGSYVPLQWGINSMDDSIENDMDIPCDPDTAVRDNSAAVPSITDLKSSLWNNMRRGLRGGYRSSLRSLRRNILNERLMHAIQQDTNRNRMIVSSPVMYEYITAPRFY